MSRGYVGYSKSVRAVQAESDERYPLTKASAVLAEKMGWTKTKAKAFLKAQGTSEWHHTSKKYNCTDYYDVSDEELEELAEKLQTFNYVPEEKRKVTTRFKCWNFKTTSDPRRWEWKITNREGNHLYPLDYALKKVDQLEKELSKISTTHKTRLRMLSQQLLILAKIKREIISALEKR
jgi:hypothetical protein